ncbi:MAG TPA: hypothetical protein VIY66_01520 [Candidatus Acidoferrales bacterium]
MDSIFDIFKLLPEGPVWVTGAQGLSDANEQMARLVQSSPGEYFIRSREEIIEADQSEEWAEVT